MLRDVSKVCIFAKNEDPLIHGWIYLGMKEMKTQEDPVSHSGQGRVEGVHPVELDAACITTCVAGGVW